MQQSGHRFEGMLLTVEEEVTEPALASSHDLRPAAVVWLLGISQIIGYGTLYYSFSILADAAATSFAWSSTWLYGVFSAALLLGSLVAPEVGRRIDRHGAGAVMSVGSAAATVSLLLAAASPITVIFEAARRIKLRSRPAVTPV